MFYHHSVDESSRAEDIVPFHATGPHGERPGACNDAGDVSKI